MSPKKTSPQGRRRKAVAGAKRQASDKSKAKAKVKAKVTRKVKVEAKTKGPSPVGRPRSPNPGQTIAVPAAAPPAARSIFQIVHPDVPSASDLGFRDAPDGWTPEQARALAAQAGLTLTDDHWEVIRVLQGCYKDEVAPRIRLLRDALEARFASKGGMKYLYELFPGGPIAQGCTLAGLKPPHGARDLSFGSVA